MKVSLLVVLAALTGALVLWLSGKQDGRGDAVVRSVQEPLPPTSTVEPELVPPSPKPTSGEESPRRADATQREPLAVESQELKLDPEATLEVTVVAAETGQTIRDARIAIQPEPPAKPWKVINVPSNEGFPGHAPLTDERGRATLHVGRGESLQLVTSLQLPGQRGLLVRAHAVRVGRDREASCRRRGRVRSLRGRCRADGRHHHDRRVPD